METKKNSNFSEKPIIRILLIIFSITFIIVGTIGLIKGLLSSLLIIGPGLFYLWTEIHVILNPKLIEDEELIISTIQSELAFWWQRLICLIIDCTICTIFTVILIFFLKLPFEQIYIISIVVFIIYYISLESTIYTTIGKAAFRLKVINVKNRNKPDFEQIVARTFCRFIPFDIFTFISIKPIGWHDSISGTAVIKNVKKTNNLKFPR